MIIKEIFEKNIQREINPAVVVSDQKKDTVLQEIEEYIFTDELLESLYRLLDSVVNRRSGKTGIWINGYYGSGKSHFIKFAHYCLSKETSSEAFLHFAKAAAKYDTTKGGNLEDITPSNIKLLEKKIQSSEIEDILFNVEDVTADGAYKQRLTRVLLDMLNKNRGYNANDIPLAILFEKYLDKKGKLGEFKILVAEELGHDDWTADAAIIASFELESILEIAKRLVPELDTKALHHKLTDPDSFKIDIEGVLIPELKDYIKDKGPNYRLIFLVDEISQYVGTNKEILLNFQNIIERISQDLNNQVWLACTAQQTLEEVSQAIDGIEDVRDEFGKILGRFDIRISLQSNDASFITQKRILDKNAAGIEALGKIYRDNKDYIHNQFKVKHELYKGYEDLSTFELAYPFVPYQFRLISNVFDAFQNLGYVIKQVKDNERSLLGITHFTVKLNQNLELGEFIPFDGFFNQQLEQNLTQRGLRAISNAMSLPYVQKDPFAERVVKALFMISNLPDSTKMTFPSNVDNLTILMMDKLDQNKLQLQTKIKEVLDRLAEESIIREEKGSYFFFNEDEIDVQNFIKNQSLSLDDRWTEFDNFFRKMVNFNSNKTTFANNDFKISYWIDEKEIFRNGDFQIKVLLIDKSDYHTKALSNAPGDLMIGLSHWFMKDKDLVRDFEWYAKTKKYFTNNSDSASGERSRTIDNFKVRNDALREKITRKIQDKFQETDFILGQRVVDASEINGTLPADRFKNAITKHLEKVYHKNKASERYAKNQMELREIIKHPVQADLGLDTAEQEVNDFITAHGDEVNVDELIKSFEKAPFGWKFEAVLHVLYNLEGKKKREFVYQNSPRYAAKAFIEQAMKTSERTVCWVKSGEEIPQSTIDEVTDTFKNIFNKDLHKTTNGNELSDFLKLELEKFYDSYEKDEETFYGSYPFGTVFHQLRKKLDELKSVRDPKLLFKRLGEQQQELKECFDLAKGMTDIMSRAKGDYDAIAEFYKNNLENIRELSPEAIEKSEKIAEFLNSEDPRFDLRHIIKAYKELKEEIKAWIDQIRQEVLDQYSRIFDELDEEAQSLNLTEGSVFADKETILNSIRKINSITQLKLKQSQGMTFKSENLEKILHHVSKKSKTSGTGIQINEPEVYFITNVKATIANEEELETYLGRVRKDMSSLLKANKTIIIK
ncbi:MAG: BREX system P-loop protein BrxC [Algoriphagus sp.]|nr:BREX system P-loop protein BrxC [Algoriphagus sp.]